MAPTTSLDPLTSLGVELLGVTSDYFTVTVQTIKAADKLGNNVAKTNLLAGKQKCFPTTQKLFSPILKFVAEKLFPRLPMCSQNKKHGVKDKECKNNTTNLTRARPGLTRIHLTHVLMFHLIVIVCPPSVTWQNIGCKHWFPQHCFLFCPGIKNKNL